jgi:hypothetical protein
MHDMSDARPTRDPDTQPIPRVGGGGGERRRAAIALLILAVIAVGVVALMVKLLGGSSGSSNAQPTIIYTGPPVTHFGSNTSPQVSNSVPSSEPETSPSSTGPTGPSNRHVSCPTSAPCPLPDDIGDVLGALNSYRQEHHLGPVRGKVTSAAATCAATAASQCPSGFHWEPVGRSGQQVIQKIAARGGGELAFLLDPALKRVQIGWAYVPESHSFYCALVANAP